jgi:uncharacterized membrane protein YidH (DUF202 family)
MTGEPPKHIRTLGDVFWLLPGIYHAHAAGLCAFLAIICVAFCRASWNCWPHCCITLCGSFIFLIGVVLIIWANVHYVLKFREKRRDPKAEDVPKAEVHPS